MVRHATVPINTLKSGPLQAHHAAIAAAASSTTATTTTAAHSFGEHRRISSIPGSKTAAAFLTSLSANLTIADVDSPFPSPVGTPPMRGGADFSNSHMLPPPSPLASAIPMSADRNGPDSSGADMLSPSFAAAAAAAPAPVAAKSRSNSSPADGSHGSSNSNTRDGDDPLAGVPELVTETATTDEDKVEALRLIADSIAQQRQVASWAIISHPMVLAAYVLIMAVMAHYIWHTPSDLPLLFTTGAGITMAFLVAVRLATGPYITQAEALNWNFLSSSSSSSSSSSGAAAADSEDTVLVTRFGERVVGALVLGWALPPRDAAGNRAQRRSRKGRGVVRAWTVLLKYRGKGIGTELLEEATRVTAKRGGEGVEFAEDHANSRLVLPASFNKAFTTRAEHARAALEAVVQRSAAFGGKRRRSRSSTSSF